jgi:hypothetical protein
VTRCRNGTYVEEVVEEVQRANAHVQGELTLRATSRRRKHTQHHAALGDALHEVKLTHRPSEQVSAHLGGGVEHDFLEHRAAGPGHVGGGGLRHVGERSEVRGDDEGDAEGGFDGGFVPAREGAVVGTMQD